MLLQKYYHALLAFPIFAGAPLCGASRNIRFDPRKLEGQTTPESSSSHKQRVLELGRRQNLETTVIQSPVVSLVITPVPDTIFPSIPPTSLEPGLVAVTDVGDWGKCFHERS